MYEASCIYKVPKDLVETNQQVFYFHANRSFSNKFTSEPMIQVTCCSTISKKLARSLFVIRNLSSDNDITMFSNRY